MTTREHSPETTSAQILLVDDEPDQVEMYRYALEDSGFVVISASTGSDAVTRARDLGPDVIVLDVRLPDMTGWDVCRVLKADPRTEHIPVIVLTAAATPTLATDAANAGCAAYLLKPCYPDQLAISIRNVLATA
jgi:two-component system phosphate regulon response regulator PhoB